MSILAMAHATHAPHFALAFSLLLSRRAAHELRIAGHTMVLRPVLSLRVLAAILAVSTRSSLVWL